MGDRHPSEAPRSIGNDQRIALDLFFGAKSADSK